MSESNRPPLRKEEVAATSISAATKLPPIQIPGSLGKATKTTVEDVHTELESFLAVVKQFAEAKPGGLVERSTGGALLLWLKQKITGMDVEKTFSVPEGMSIRAKTVCWVDFGVNPGNEISGRLPALVYRVTPRDAPRMIIAAPLHLDPPTAEQQAQGIFVNIGKVFGKFSNKDRWVNALDFRPYSVQRVVFTGAFGYISDEALRAVNSAIRNHSVATPPPKGEKECSSLITKPEAALREDLMLELEASIRKYVAARSATSDDCKLTAALLRWMTTKVLLATGQTLGTSDEAKLSRAVVCWVEFGVNVGDEFGGRHPVIVIRHAPGTIFVGPLSSQSPTPGQLTQGIYVEVDTVYGPFLNKKRWVNILDIRPVSTLRVDYSSTFGHVKGDILDSINAAMLKSGLGREMKR